MVGADGVLQVNVPMFYRIRVNGDLPNTDLVISSPGDVSGSQTQSFNYQISASGNPTSFGALGLPPGLVVNGTTGLISGTPTDLGESTVTLIVASPGVISTKTLTLSVSIAPPAITSAISFLD